MADSQVESEMKRRKKKPEAAFNNLYMGYRGGARQRAIGFELTKEQFQDIIGRRCTYCGREPFQISWCRKGDGNGRFIKYMGIDREDPNRGYIQGNVVPCCVNCNYGKHDMSMREWSTYLDTLVQYRQSLNIADSNTQ